MIRYRFSRALLIGCALVLAATGAIRAQQGAAQGGQQQPAAPTGPLAPEKYKDIQVLKDVPADQLDLTMRYFVAATGLQCSSCHMRDQATGVFTYEQDTRTKTTARNMIKLVQSVNAGDFGARINCGTCHAGRNQPQGLQPAQMMTPDQIAAAAAAQAGQAARQGGAGGAAGGGGAPGGAAGRGNQPPAPAVDDVLAKYVTAIGGAAAGKIQSLAISGTVATRAGQSASFTIEEKAGKYRETIGTDSFGFDGTAGWSQNATAVSDVTGFPLQQALRLNDLPRMASLKEKYPNLQAGRPARLPAARPGGTPVDVNLLQATPMPGVTERFYFDATSGLLVRHQVVTRTPLNGTLTETIDYADYRAVSGVMLPFSIKRNTWSALDTLTVSDVKANTSIADSRFAKPR